MKKDDQSLAEMFEFSLSEIEKQIKSIRSTAIKFYFSFIIPLFMAFFKVLTENLADFVRYPILLGILVFIWIINESIRKKYLPQIRELHDLKWDIRWKLTKKSFKKEDVFKVQDTIRKTL